MDKTRATTASIDLCDNWFLNMYSDRRNVKGYGDSDMLMHWAAFRAEAGPRQSSVQRIDKLSQ